MSSDYDPREYPASLCDGRCAVANRGGQLVGCHSKNSTDPWIVGVFGGNMSVTGMERRKFRKTDETVIVYFY